MNGTRMCCAKVLLLLLFQLVAFSSLSHAQSFAEPSDGTASKNSIFAKYYLQQSEDQQPPVPSNSSQATEPSQLQNDFQSVNRESEDNQASQQTPVPLTPQETEYLTSFLNSYLTDFLVGFDAQGIQTTNTGITLPKGWSVLPFGFLRGEMVYAQQRTVADAVQFFLAPNNLGVDDDSITFHAKTSFLNFAFKGPERNGWESGGLILINFLGPQPLRNNSGLNVINAFGYVERDGLRLSAGRMVDLFSPINPTSINSGQHRGGGNVGIFRGGFGVDRMIERSPTAKWTLSGRISQNTVNDFLLLPTARGVDNGIPNFEGRIGVELGCECDGQRPIELGISGLWGETRAFDPAQFIEETDQIVFLGAVNEVSTTAGLCVDYQWRGPRFGIRGEFFAAQAAGTYFVAALQTLSTDTGQGIRSIGGWSEVYFKFSEKTTFTFGAGIDDPRNNDVGQITAAINDPGQRLYNHVLWTNVIHDINDIWEVGFEVAHRKTHYFNDLSSSSGFVTNFRSTLKY